MEDKLQNFLDTFESKRHEGESWMKFYERAGVHPNVVNNWRRGRNRPSLPVVQRIARKLELKPEELQKLLATLNDAAQEPQPVKIEGVEEKMTMIRALLKNTPMSSDRRELLTWAIDELVTNGPNARLIEANLMAAASAANDGKVVRFSRKRPANGESK